MTRESSVSVPKVILLIGAVQFVNILDFMIVMPLGPDFSRELGIPTSNLGWIGGAYTAAAAMSGLLGSLVLDRFDRRSALAVAMAGLVVGTVAGGFAQGLATLVAARLVAGFFGGPATSVANSIIADLVPPHERGRAMGAVMGAFSVASVVGVPVGLELSRQGGAEGWRLPFFAVAALGVLLTMGTWRYLPPLRGHLSLRAPNREEIAARSVVFRLFGFLAHNPLMWRSLSMTAVVMLAGFLVIPNIAAYVLHNLGYPRERLGLLYLAGGAVSFFTMRWVGYMVDRFGSFRVGSVGTVLLMTVLYTGFVAPSRSVAVMPMFVGFMVAMSFRNVSYHTLTSKVPRPEERARFMSMQSCVQHMASACGAFLSAHLLSARADQSLAGMPQVAWLSFALTLVLPALLWNVERGVARQRATTAIQQGLA